MKKRRRMVRVEKSWKTRKWLRDFADNYRGGGLVVVFATCFFFLSFVLSFFLSFFFFSFFFLSFLLSFFTRTIFFWQQPREGQIPIEIRRTFFYLSLCLSPPLMASQSSQT